MILSLYIGILLSFRSLRFFLFTFYLNFKIDCSSSRRSCPPWHNDKRNKCFRIKEVATSGGREREGEGGKNPGTTEYQTNTFAKISRRTARSHDEEFRSYFVSDAISGPAESRYHPRASIGLSHARQRT